MPRSVWVLVGASVCAWGLLLAPGVVPAAPVRRCPSISFAPRSEQVVSAIRTRNVKCSTARRLILSRLEGHQPWYTATWTCRITARHHSAVRYGCVRHDRYHGRSVTRVVRYRVSD